VTLIRPARGEIPPPPRRRKFAHVQFATAQGRPSEAADNDNREGSLTEEGAMNGIILFVTPAVAALGALATLRLFVQARNAAKTNPARVRVPARRPHWR
jgi:hypothetical protein